MRHTLFLLTVASLLVSCQAEKPTTKAPSVEAQPVNIPQQEIPTQDTVASSPFDIEYITGRFEPATHPDFVKIATKYADREGMYLRKEVYASFKAMHVAASKEGMKLVIRSATRNFKAQKGIWEAKWTGKRILSDGKNAKTDYPTPKDRALKILEYSSMPGTSRHHWGTDLDLNSFNNNYFAKGEGLKIYNWLLANASTYGFCQPYTAKDEQRPNGYNEEKWHWSYIPTAKKLTDQAKSELKDTTIQGFQGANTAPSIQVIQNYVFGINKACL